MYNDCFVYTSRQQYIYATKALITSGYSSFKYLSMLKSGHKMHKEGTSLPTWNSRIAHYLSHRIPFSCEFNHSVRSRFIEYE